MCLTSLTLCRPDPVTPIEEIVRAFNWLIDRGLAFYWATSEWSALQISEACAIAGVFHRMITNANPKLQRPKSSALLTDNGSSASST